MELRVIFSGIVGGIAYWLTAFLFYVALFADFFAKNWGAGHREPIKMWAILISCLFFGMLIAFIFDRWAGIKTMKSGAVAGAMIGVLHSLNLNFLRYGDSTIYASLTPVVMNILLNVVMAIIAGGVVGFMLSKMSRGNEA